MKSKLIKAIVSCIVVIGIGFGGYYTYNTYFAKKTVTTTSRSYNTSVKKMNLSETIQGTGSAYAATTKEVTPNNNGTLKDLSVKVGDTVTSGQKLFVSDSDELRKNVTTAQNNLTKQNLTLSTDESADKVDDNRVASDKIAVSEATTSLTDAKKQVTNMTVTAPFGGKITAVDSSNGDSVQSGKSVLTIVDMSSMKIKVSVDELDIAKVKIGQKATIKFDAITDKSYEGAVESISETGTTSNSVTTYEVVVSVTNPTGIKLGMNATVTISVENKDNALVIPAEALVEKDSKKYVRVVDTATSATSQTNNNGQTPNQAQSSAAAYKLVEIKTGLETQNYIEVTEGLTEGQQVVIQLPSSSSSTNSRNNGGGFPGGDMGGGMPGGSMPSGGFPSGGMPGGGSSSGSKSK